MITQGKWEYHKSTTGIRYIHGKKGVVLAIVEGLEDGKDNANKAIEADFNARLIAAAPELLEVLKNLVEAIKYDAAISIDEECKNAIAAIAAAETT